MVKILISDPIDAVGINTIKNNPKFDVCEGLNSKGLHQIDAWLVRSETKVTRDKIEQAKRLRLIGRAGTGVDNIDVQAATERGILVINVPGANAIAVAEHVFALLLTLIRKIAAADRIVKSGGWRDKSLMGNELYGKTLGLIGLGRVGKEVARRANAFSMKVITYDPFISEQSASALGVASVSLEDLIANADVISVHVPLTESSRGLINKKMLAQMKPTSVLVNTSRGEVIIENDLIEALRSNQIAGAALDVYAKEPPKESLLLGLGDKVILSPHLGATTREAQRRVAQELAQSVIDFFDRGLVRGGVNLPPEFEPEILERLGPHLMLAERMGRFLGQLNPGVWHRLKLSTVKKFPEKEQKVLLHAAIRGVLSCSMGNAVNMVNAIFYAEERHIQTRYEYLPEAANSIEEIALSLRAGNGQMCSVSGRVEVPGEFRIVRIGDLFVDVVPSGTLIAIDNQDRPGMIGKVGSLLGNRKINISDMRVGRKRKGKEAIMVLTLDNDISDRVIEEISRIDGVTKVSQIRL